MRILFIHLLSCLIVTSSFGMQIIKKPFKKSFIRTAINKSAELDVMRATWGSNHSPEEVVEISQGKIVIKEEITLGKRYGVCHNYVFTKLMGIVGKAPKVLNISGCTDYYGDDYLNIWNFFEFLELDAVLQPGDVAVYLLKNEDKCAIRHTGIVVGDDCIESKWGIIAAVFEHPIWYVPEVFGNHCRYLRPKISGSELLVKVQQRLQEKEIKERYDDWAQNAQKQLFHNIKQYEQDRSDESFYQIYKILECDMNTHIDVPDEHGITPLMYVENIGCEKLKEFFAEYEAHRE